MLSESLGVLLAQIAMDFGGILIQVAMYSCLMVLATMLMLCVLTNIIMRTYEERQEYAPATLNDFVISE
jgi:hypothetical protein